ncbi:MAG TPA: NAD-dependent epimerase/dehydratase family protein [Stackebrandtia sp.]|uniref:NAD-dependent epimerase/dehydratase family protein n=1 Tax=Stackebrandtia sp. TaxID=2023065 RepID=UPI002D637271|nr:NAD-dependent epimerase/dehydratase family protein [Stackebrandtia sp.]HZE39980.1 NAD-dependent epimerase/dehydratase family protein [Stackebrandtia sp.]
MENNTIVVTGGAGFVGSHLIAALARDYPRSRIVSVDNYFTGRRDVHVDAPNVTYLEDSTANINKRWANESFGTPDIVFHLGEYARIPQSFDEPDRVWEYNAWGTKEVVKFCLDNGARLVYAGSSSKFGNDGQDEHLNPYAWTKAKNGELIRNYGNWYGLDYVITYFYNVYGPGQIEDGRYATAIGIFQRQYRDGEPLTIVEPGTQSRDFTHIDDTVAGLLRCAEHGKGDGYLIGAGREWQMLEVAKLFGCEHVMIPAKPGERARGEADNSKVRALGWEPKVALEDYVADFVASARRG